MLLLTVLVVQICLKVTDNDCSYVESGKAFDTEIIQSAASVTEEFGKDRGMISVRCSSFSGGGVYIYINNTMRANITSAELKNLKVKKGDVIIVKGHSLQSDVTVTVENVVGNVDTSVTGTSVTVGNLGKYLVSIK